MVIGIVAVATTGGVALPAVLGLLGGTVTAGTAIVTVGTFAAGAAAVTFGVADVLEASQDLGYGVEGSSKASFNPLRDTMFTGNEDLYYLVKTMATYGAVSGLYVYQSYDMGSQLGVTGGASFKPDELVVRDSKFLNADGDVDWETWAPNNGRVPDTEIEGQTLDVGILIDRYENPYGKYTSPVGVPYEQRSLPHFENPDAYHKYEVLKSINDVTISQISEAFEQPGGGVQYELPSSVNQLIKDGFLKEIK